jgi:predicted TIM-barrel fold metal-dependent hydrolase
VIDAHNHLGEEFGGSWYKRPVSEFTDLLDAAHITHFVDLDGGWGEHILEHRLDKFKAAIPDRYLVFGGVDWSEWPQHGEAFGEWAAGEFRRQIGRGAQGLKIWKNFGLQVRDQHNRLVPVDDARLIPLWETAAELRVPVLIHVADPVAFFDPLDQHNERWEELYAHLDWQFPSPPFPTFETILDQFAHLVARHPRATFIGAHVGCYAENLDWVSKLLDQCPNLYVDFAARIAELGRQPYSARRFFLKYADRIVFGTDLPASVDWYRLHYRFLETDDEYFNYDLKPIPSQGRWRIHGLHLPDDVLEKVYQLNARRILNLA